MAILNKEGMRAFSASHKSRFIYKPKEVEEPKVNTFVAQEVTKPTEFKPLVQQQQSSIKNTPTKFNLDSFNSVADNVSKEFKKYGKNVSAEDIKKVMYIESRGNPAAQNNYNKKARGLIQFYPDKEAAGLPLNEQYKTIGGKRYNLDEVQNMDYVSQEKLMIDYFKDLGAFNKGTNIRGFQDVYNLVFFPKAVGKDDDWVFKSKNDPTGAGYRKANSAYDPDGRGFITIASQRAVIDKIGSGFKKNKLFNPTPKGKQGLKTNKFNIMTTTNNSKINYVAKYGTSKKQVRKFQEGGATEGMPAEGAPAGGGGEMEALQQQLLQLLEPVVQSQDPAQALEAVNQLYQAIGGTPPEGGGEAAPAQEGAPAAEGTPMARLGMKTGPIFSVSIKGIK